MPCLWTSHRSDPRRHFLKSLFYTFFTSACWPQGSLQMIRVWDPHSIQTTSSPSLVFLLERDPYEAFILLDFPLAYLLQTRTVYEVFVTYKGGSYPCLGFGVPFAECLQCEKFMFKNKGVLVSRFCQGILFFSLFDIQVPICWPRVPKMLLLLPNHKHQHHPLHRSVKLLALYHFCLTKGNTDGDFQLMSAWSFLKAILQMMALTFCLCVSEFRKGFSSVS